jgi:hypothetical protein
VNKSGQALTLILVFIPLMIFTIGVVGRSGTAALVHDQIENHCDKKILDALEIQGKGLSRLGNINPWAKLVITSRRAIDPLANAGIPYFIAAQKSLNGAQHYISIIQKSIKAQTTVESEAQLLKPSPAHFRGKIKEVYWPIPPKLHVEDEEGFENEVGAPQQPDPSFKEKQSASGRVEITTERFLWWWPDRNLKSGLRSPNMFLQCKAKLKMERLEDKWQAQLVKPAVKL